MAIARNLTQRLAIAAVFAGSIFAIHSVRTRLNLQFTAATLKHDVYPLPPPEQTVALSLGYRAALADFLFAHVLVSSGLHFQERRNFEFVGNYLDAINELDPSFEKPYLIADTLLTLQVKQVPEANYHKARAILERGMKQFPFDAALWDSAGQFLAYLGPGGLRDPAEQSEWRLAGGRILAHACEIVGSNEAVPYHCITAAGLLTSAGADIAARQFLERVLTVNDDPAIRDLAAAALTKAVGAEARDRVQDRYRRFQAAWALDLPFVSRGAYLTIGPSFDPAFCAGLTANCVTSWLEWGAENDLTHPVGGTN